MLTVNRQGANLAWLGAVLPNGTNRKSSVLQGSEENRVALYCPMTYRPMSLPGKGMGWVWGSADMHIF